jgi:uncharacterized membrane protein YphA (DoxX/SURF4 family)
MRHRLTPPDQWRETATVPPRLLTNASEAPAELTASEDQHEGQTGGDDSMTRTVRRVLTVGLILAGSVCLVVGFFATIVPLQVASFLIFSALTVLILTWQNRAGSRDRG